MSSPEMKEITFGEHTHYVCFNSNALRKLEKETGMPTGRVGLALVTGRGGFDLMQTILWAGLEGARLRRDIPNSKPYTIDGVGFLLDEEGGSGIVFADEDDGFDTIKDDAGNEQRVQTREPRELHPIAIAVRDAWTSAFPAQKRKEEQVNPPAASEKSLGKTA